MSLIVEQRQSKSSSLLCQAQGYPTPVFSGLTNWLLPVRPRVIPYHHSEPVSGSRPRFSSELKSGTVERSSLSPYSLTCQAQGFPVPVFRRRVIPYPCSEPSGSVKPRFSTAATSTSLLHSNSAALSLFCAAQGFPVPITRTRGLDPTQTLPRYQIVERAASV
ncbi:hypothetical protein OUZ56_013734 [Daphnia magna]|uniref:Ig-like domain-containing protein n=1 Tax=Daphnia magna TaxID=35525 RepID=A0ABQ9Z6T3_9CRUS|nr:hypothetical protein OUZ56_013734 [Daphnia magna]